MKLVSLVFAAIFLVGALTIAFSAPQAETQGDQFFAGTVAESTSEQLTVARVLQGRSESRTFRMTVDTKVEGPLTLGVRVTVRYITEDEGDRATLVIVRVEGKNKK